MTLRHTLELHTQHSAKEYVFRLEQTRSPRPTRRVARPDLTALRGTSLAAQEARATLITKMQEECARTDQAVSLTQFREIASKHTLNVCGETKRSGRAPWLRSQAAHDAVAPLNNQCRYLRSCKHDIQRQLSDSPDNAQLLIQLTNLQDRH